MAHVEILKRKKGTAYRIHYYVNNRLQTKPFPVGTPRKIMEAEKKRIESEVTLHKSGLKTMEMQKNRQS